MDGGHGSVIGYGRAGAGKTGALLAGLDDASPAAAAAGASAGAGAGGAGEGLAVQALRLLFTAAPPRVSCCAVELLPAAAPCAVCGWGGRGPSARERLVDLLAPPPALVEGAGAAVGGDTAALHSHALHLLRTVVHSASTLTALLRERPL